MNTVGTTAANWDVGSWRAIAAFVLVAGLPGIAVARVARRSASDLTLLQRSAAGIACGAFCWILVAEILVRAGILTTVLVWAASGIVAAAAIAVMAWDVRLNARPLHRRAISCEPPPIAGQPTGEPAEATQVGASGRVLRPALRVANSVVPVLLVAGSLGPQLALTRADSLISPTPWYYWLISQTLARTGHVPRTMIEWGQPVTTFTFHFGFSSSSSFLAVALGDPRSLAPTVGIRVLSLFLFAYGVWVIARALGASTWGAAAAAVVAQYIDIYATKLSGYRPESAAYGLAFIGVALLIWAIKARSRILIAAGVAGVIAAGQIHEISALLALSLMVGVALIVILSAVLTRGRRVSLLAPMLSFAASAFVLTIALNYIMIGRWSEGDAVAGLPDVTDGYDPTWAFNRLVSPHDLNLQDVGRDAPTTSTLVADSLRAEILGLPSWALIALSIALGAGLILAIPWSTRARRLGILLVAAFGTMLLLSFFISGAGTTYVPRRTGYQRLLQLWPVLPLIATPAAVAGLRWKLVRRLATALLVAASVVVAWEAPGSQLFSALDAEQPSSAQLAALQAAPIPPRAIILTNGYTQGFITLQTKGYGLLDGHAPYLERDLLRNVNTILKLTRQYFTEPRKHPFPFCRYHVSYVMTSKMPYALGTQAIWLGGPVDSDPRLARVQQNVYYALYRVIDPCPT